MNQVVGTFQEFFRRWTAECHVGCQYTARAIQCAASFPVQTMDYFGQPD